MNAILYTTHCPLCNVLKKKLEESNISFIEIDNVDTIREIGHQNHISYAPILKVEDKYFNFSNAIAFLKNIEVK